MAKEKNLTTVTSVAAADLARVVTSAGASVKATFANVAKYIVETYNGSTVAGSAQSVKSALDSLNSKTSTLITADNYKSVLATFSTMSVVPVFVDQSLMTVIYGITGINGTGLCIRHTASIFDFVFFDTRIRLVRYNTGTDTFSRKYYFDMIAE